MKILQLTNFYPPPFAGTERYIVDLAEHLLKRGHEVHLVYIPMIYDRKNAALKFEPPKGATLSYIPDRFSFFKLYREIKKSNPDVIHAYYLKTGILAGIIGSILKKPVVCSVLLADEKTKHLKRKIGLWMMRPLFQKITYMAVSNEIEESIKKDIPQINVKMIPCWTWNQDKMQHANGSWLRKRFPKNAKIFLTVGRVVEEKGIRHLIYVAQEASKKRDNVYFAIVGTGAMLEEYKELVKQLGLGKKVVFLGKISESELLGSYKGCNAVILPSVMDSLFAVTESLAVGKPIISNATRSAGEIIENGRNGLVADVTNPKEFSDAILSVIDSPVLRKKLIIGAKAKSIEYSSQRCIDKIEEIYKSVI